MDIAANIEQIREQIDAVCQRCGRDPKQVRLVAVSKKKPASDIEAAIAAGQQLFGESYVQECAGKIDEVQAQPEWHFVGG
ncbi:MAG: YggS family pyridoxal phosphate-dependent enzyme, partial [Desulfuromonadales bacterium]|nr:YggS family pyridoxal phosphate-dependent enzyme [Desulfuromonadales bacterium]